MIAIRKYTIALFVSGTAIMCITAGCDVGKNDQFRTEYVVESYLYALEPFGEVRLSQTVGFGRPYRFADQAVDKAMVSVSLMGEAGAVEAVFAFEESPVKGIYLPLDAQSPVLPLRRYRLEVIIPDTDQMLHATTLVPDTFQILRSTVDTVVFGSSAQLEIDLTENVYPGRQTVFVFSTQSFEPTFENLTPFFKDIFDEDEDSLEDFRVNESPPINEENYDRNPDGTLTIKLPWIAVNFYGPNRITANAIDDNIFNFITSQDLQNNPSTLSPGEVPNVLDPIEGGVGIFGSYARVIKNIYISRP